MTRRTLLEYIGPAVRIPVPREVVQLWREAGMRGGSAWRVGACKVIVAQEPLGPVGALRWHLSISHDDRYPSWDEVAEARYQLVPDDVTMVMMLPPSSEYVNQHDTCFHLHEAERSAGIVVIR